MTDQPNIVVSGDLMIEVTVPHDQFPGPDATLTISLAGRNLGGSALNLCWYFAQLGDSTSLHSFVGNDQAGALSAILVSSNIDTRFVQEFRGITNILLIFERDGMAHSLYLPSPLDSETIAKYPLPNSAGSTIFFAGSRNALIQETVLEQLEQTGSALVFAPSYALSAMEFPIVDRYLRRAALSCFNRSEADIVRRLTGFQELGALAIDLKSVIVETMGADGAAIYTPLETITVKSYSGSSENVLGAGDGFTAGLFSAFRRGASWLESARFASLIAAQIVDRQQIRATLTLEGLWPAA